MSEDKRTRTKHHPVGGKPRSRPARTKQRPVPANWQAALDAAPDVAQGERLVFGKCKECKRHSLAIDVESGLCYACSQD
jgi:hypothetical protein